MGDFNLPTLDWSIDGSETRGARAIDRVFVDSFVAAGLTRWVREPTFVQSGNILDLILTSELHRVGDVRLLRPLPGCFHSPIVCDYFFGFGREEAKEWMDVHYLWW